MLVVNFILAEVEMTRYISIDQWYESILYLVSDTLRSVTDIMIPINL